MRSGFGHSSRHNSFVPAATKADGEVGRQSRASSVPIRSSGRFGRRDGPAAFAEVPEAAPVEPFSPPPRRPWGFSSLRSGRRQNSPRQRLFYDNVLCKAVSRSMVL
eukprot:s4666_g6.t1